MSNKTIQSFSICLPQACDANCPYCISKQTGRDHCDKFEVTPSQITSACRFAVIGDTTTVLFTGKGEPMLYPDEISYCMSAIKKYEFPFVEIQTNGIRLWNEWENMERYLIHWRNLGMTTISISIAHYLRKRNEQIFAPTKYPDIGGLIAVLKELGFMVRINCTLIKDFIDNWDEFSWLWYHVYEKWKTDQLVIRPVVAYGDGDEAEWARENAIPEDELKLLVDLIKSAPSSEVIRKLVHGGEVLSFRGKNLCLSNCLTADPDNREDMRQLILMPDGSITTDWKHSEAARLM
jgi:molybdenum cofactor biosynthesis enzyme MoaA